MGGRLQRRAETRDLQKRAARVAETREAARSRAADLLQQVRHRGLLVSQGDLAVPSAGELAEQRLGDFAFFGNHGLGAGAGNRLAG